MKAEAIKYHKRVQDLTCEDLEEFINTQIATHMGTVDELVAKIESFMTCLLPYRIKELERQIQGLDDYEVSIHQAMCCLGVVSGKTDDGVKLGQDCSYFGRFHGRLEEYFFRCMI
jgi:hypothetical protein